MSLVLIFLLALWWLYESDHPKGENPNPLQKLTATEYAAKLPQDNFQVQALGFNSVKFDIPAGAFNVRAEGNFSVEGGLGNDIEAYIFDEDGLANWRNRHAARPFYSSGRATRGSINATLPGGPATYYVVFSNLFSLLSKKNVEAHVTLYYSK